MYPNLHLGINLSNQSEKSKNFEFNVNIFFALLWSFAFTPAVPLGKWYNTQKQLFKGVLLKRCSENMQQIYRRKPISKCDFNKVAKQQLY